MSDDDRGNDLVVDLTDAGDKALKARESKRRYEKYMKDCFTRLRDVLPALRSNMQATRLQILEEAADYIPSMQAKNSALQQAIDDMKSRNRILEDDNRSVEDAKATDNCAADILEGTRISSSRTGAVPDFDVDSEDSSDNSNPSKDGPRKRLNPN